MAAFLQKLGLQHITIDLLQQTGALCGGALLLDKPGASLGDHRPKGILNKARIEHRRKFFPPLLSSSLLFSLVSSFLTSHLHQFNTYSAKTKSSKERLKFKESKEGPKNLETTPGITRQRSKRPSFHFSSACAESLSIIRKHLRVTILRLCNKSRKCCAIQMDSAILEASGRSFGLSIWLLVQLQSGRIALSSTI